MSILFDYPAKAAFGRVLPKNKIYERARPSAALKELFVRQVEQIIWAYKLAPETINLPGAPAVPEIQVFRITLKNAALDPDVLNCIDKAIPFPIVFELFAGGRCKAAACFKRPSETDSARWVVSDTFASDWLPESAPRAMLPVVLDLAALYEALLSPLLPYPALPGEALPHRIERIENIRIKERELHKTEARLAREKQFNRKVEINAKVRALRQDIAKLMGPT